jgi:hypothetical protein
MRVLVYPADGSYIARNLLSHLQVGGWVGGNARAVSTCRLCGVQQGPSQAADALAPPLAVPLLCLGLRWCRRMRDTSCW